MTAVRIGAVRPEGRDLQRHPVRQYRHGAVFDAGLHDAEVLEDFFRFVLKGGRRQIVVVRVLTGKQVAHAAADQAGLISGLPQRAKRMQDRFRDPALEGRNRIG